MSCYTDYNVLSMSCYTGYAVLSNNCYTDYDVLSNSCYTGYPVLSPFNELARVPSSLLSIRRDGHVITWSGLLVWLVGLASLTCKLD